MIQERQLVSIFCEIDDFCKELDKNMSQLQLTGPSKGRRGPACCLSISEIIPFKYCFKWLDIATLKHFTRVFYRYIGSNISLGCPVISVLLS
jgi:hypothetical protein